ncbi:Hypothetical predicted protein, partial [Pelobates cultripes]
VKLELKENKELRVNTEIQDYRDLSELQDHRAQKVNQDLLDCKDHQEIWGYLENTVYLGNKVPKEK